MVCLVVAMIWTLPKKCDPYTEWYQGGVFYEVFPASFCDSNNDMIGDFRGMAQDKCLNYTKSLGVRAIRLNSIFETPHYPEDYKNVSTLVRVASQLGSLNDFKQLVNKVHLLDMKLILDLPVYPVIDQLSFKKKSESFNNSHLEPVVEFLRAEPPDLVKEALLHWINLGVDGFYLKGLEYFIDDVNLGNSLRLWKSIIGPDRIFIVNEAVINSALPDMLNLILNNINLVDVHLEISKGIGVITKQIDHIQNGTLFAQKGSPWVHWNLGDEISKRLANLLPYGNATLGATLLQLMLPGTPSIFYGNEVGLQQTLDPEVHDVKHLHQLAVMAFENSPPQVLPWMPAAKKAVNFREADAVADMIKLRSGSPSIYINSVFKEGDNKANADVKHSKSDVLVIQRWYPRRKSHVVVSNLGNSSVTTDLSKLLYSGVVKIGPRPDSISESISFKDIALAPGESVVIQLD